MTGEELPVCPPGFVKVNSNSRPGQVSYMDGKTRERYSSNELAWAAYETANPSPCALPKGYYAVPSNSRPGHMTYLCPATGERFATCELAYEAVLPAGYHAVPSQSRPGQFAFVSDSTGEKYATVELAWQAFKKPASVAPASPPKFNVIPPANNKQNDLPSAYIQNSNVQHSNKPAYPSIPSPHNAGNGRPMTTPSRLDVPGAKMQSKFPAADRTGLPPAPPPVYERSGSAIPPNAPGSPPVPEKPFVIARPASMVRRHAPKQEGLHSYAPPELVAGAGQGTTVAPRGAYQNQSNNGGLKGRSQGPAAFTHAGAVSYLSQSSNNGATGEFAHGSGSRRFWRDVASSHNDKDVPLPNQLPPIERDGGWIDREFPPNSASIGAVSSEDLTSRLRISAEERNNAKWIRIPQLIAMNCGLPNTNMVQLFDDIGPNDLTQGVVGDCWLLASMAALAEYPDAVRSLISPQELSRDGKYTVQLYDLAQLSWVTVDVDDRVPCRLSDDWTNVPFRLDEKGQKIYDARVPPRKRWQPLFANPTGNEMWCLLIEKAMAKFVGTYSKIAGGHEPFAFIAFTGHSQVYEFKRLATDDKMTSAVRGQWERGWAQYNNRERPTCGYRADQDNPGPYDNSAVFDKFERYFKRNYLMAGSITCFSMPPTMKGYFRRDGLVLGHAYSILQVARVGRHRLIQLRNPHGKGTTDVPTEWLGAWSDDSSEWSRYPDVAEALEFTPMNDGAFWMSWDDFADIFDKLIVLAAPMAEPQDGDDAHLTRRIAELGKKVLSAALAGEDKRVLARMSVNPYDPYLNAPAWIKNDQPKWKAWLKDKGLMHDKHKN